MTSNVFNMFTQPQIAEFKEAFKMIDQGKKYFFYFALNENSTKWHSTKRSFPQRADKEDIHQENKWTWDRYPTDTLKIIPGLDRERDL